MPRGSSSKRERQYEHIKDSAKERGASERRAKEMAARTVNKERARSGPTRDQLYAEAKRRKIEGRSQMNKSQLKKALGK